MNKQGIFYSFSETSCIIRLVGEIKYTTVAVDFGRFVDSLLDKEEVVSVVADLRDCTYIDSTDLGILARIAITMQSRKVQRPVIVYGDSDVVRKSVTDVGLGFLCTVVSTFDLDNTAFKAVESKPLPDELVLAKLMVSAHQELIDMDDDNQKKFASVVALMESEISAMEQ